MTSLFYLSFEMWWGFRGRNMAVPQPSYHILYLPGGEKEEVTNISKFMYTMLYVNTYVDTQLGQELA